MSAEFTGEALALMQSRAQGECEVAWPNVCMGHGSLQAHHRRPRGMGGTKRRESGQASNGVMACLWCHNYLETCSRGKARQLGFLVSQNANPVDERVF